MNRLARFSSWLIRSKPVLNRLTPYVLMGYFILISLPYLFARIPTLDGFFSNSISSYAIRFISFGLLILYGVALFIAYRLRICWPLVFGLAILAILSVLSNVLSPSTVVSYSYFFAGKITTTTVIVGGYAKILDFARFFSSLVFFYFISQIYAKCFCERKHITIVVLPAVAIALLGIIYSAFAEGRLLISLIGMSDDPAGIRSIFHSKNAFGIFLFEGSASAAAIALYDGRKWTRWMLVLLPIFGVFSILINCKMAAVCIFVLCFFCYFLLFFISLKKSVKISILLACLFILFFALLLVFCLVPGLHSDGVPLKLYNLITNFFSEKGISSLLGRISEWGVVPAMANGLFMFIGFSRAVGYSVVSGYSLANGSTAFNLSDLHNSFVDFYAYHGILGTAIMLLIYFAVFRGNYRIYKGKRIETGLLVSMLLLVSVLFGMAETYTLFISISANTFALTFLIVTIISMEGGSACAQDT